MNVEEFLNIGMDKCATTLWFIMTNHVVYSLCKDKYIYIYSELKLRVHQEHHQVAINLTKLTH